MRKGEMERQIELFIWGGLFILCVIGTIFYFAKTGNPTEPAENITTEADSAAEELPDATMQITETVTEADESPIDELPTDEPTTENVTGEPDTTEASEQTTEEVMENVIDMPSGVIAE